MTDRRVSLALALTLCAQTAFALPKPIPPRALAPRAGVAAPLAPAQRSLGPRLAAPAAPQRLLAPAVKPQASAIAGLRFGASQLRAGKTGLNAAAIGNMFGEGRRAPLPDMAAPDAQDGVAIIMDYFEFLWTLAKKTEAEKAQAREFTAGHYSEMEALVNELASENDAAAKAQIARELREWSHQFGAQVQTETLNKLFEDLKAPASERPAKLAEGLVLSAKAQAVVDGWLKLLESPKVDTAGSRIEDIMTAFRYAAELSGEAHVLPMIEEDLQAKWGLLQFALNSKDPGLLSGTRNEIEKDARRFSPDESKRQTEAFLDAMIANGKIAKEDKARHQAAIEPLTKAAYAVYQHWLKLIDEAGAPAASKPASAASASRIEDIMALIRYAAGLEGRGSEADEAEAEILKKWDLLQFVLNAKDPEQLKQLRAEIEKEIQKFSPEAFERMERWVDRLIRRGKLDAKDRQKTIDELKRLMAPARAAYQHWISLIDQASGPSAPPATPADSAEMADIVAFFRAAFEGLIKDPAELEEALDVQRKKARRVEETVEAVRAGEPIEPQTIERTLHRIKKHLAEFKEPRFSRTLGEIADMHVKAGRLSESERTSFIERVKAKAPAVREAFLAWQKALKEALEPSRIQVQGTLRRGIHAIGGETTGTIVQTADGFYELELDESSSLEAKARELDGKAVTVVGRLETRLGVEVRLRRIIHVERLEGR